MKVFVYIVIGLFLIVLQTTVLMPYTVWPAVPDLLYILVAYLAYRMDLLRSLIIIFPLCWTMDVFSGVIFGTYPAICLAGFFLLKVTDAKMVVRESLYQVPMIGVSYLVVHRIVYAVLSFLEPDVLAPWSWPMMMVRVVLLVIFAYPLFRFFEFVNRRMQRKILPQEMLRVRSGNRYRQEGEPR